MTNQKMIIGYAVTAMVAGGLGVFGGMTYQKTKLTPTFGQRAGGQRMMQAQNNNQNSKSGQTPNGSGPGMMGQRGMINGEVTAKDDKSVTVKMTDGSSRIVILSSNTTYRMSSDSKLEDVAVGKTIAVQGTPNADGSTTATSIELNPILRSLAPTQGK